MAIRRSLVGRIFVRSLADGYIAALHKVYDEVPESPDFVMYWWQRAAELARASEIRRFGFITQVFNRKVVAQNLNATKDPLSLIFAIPDHPRLNSLSTETRSAGKHAAVRIAMTVGERGEHQGLLYRVVSEGDTSSRVRQSSSAKRQGASFPIYE